MKTLEDYQKFGDELLKKYRLDTDGWVFVIAENAGGSANALGLCNYKYKKIFLKKAHAQFNPEKDVNDTILHEVAHALAGPAAGHGALWKRYARILGAVPSACKPVTKEYSKATYRYQLAYKDETGTIHRIERYQLRKSNLDGAYLKNRPETRNRLFWIEL